MTRCEPLSPDAYAALYAVVLAEEPFAPEQMPTLAHFRAEIATYEGFVLMDGDEIIGAMTFNALVPLMDVCLHAVVKRERRGSWVNRRVFRDVFTLPFVTWKLPRVSGYSIVGVTPYAEEALLATGFQWEGLRRRAILLPDGYHDLAVFGMLREECRWI